MPCPITMKSPLPADACNVGAHQGAHPGGHSPCECEEKTTIPMHDQAASDAGSCGSQEGFCSLHPYICKLGGMSSLLRNALPGLEGRGLQDGRISSFREEEDGFSLLSILPRLGAKQLLVFLEFPNQLEPIGAG